MNVLITSVGRRTSLMGYFQKELEGYGTLIATDCNPLAPALYKADKSYLVPPINDPSYIKRLKEICIKEEITGILSLIDPEISLLALHKKEFESLGVTFLSPSYEVCERWLDKLSGYEFCRERGLPCAKTYSTFESFTQGLQNKEVAFPIIIKPRKGSASVNIRQANNLQEAKQFYDSAENILIQEFMQGQEIGADVYVDFHSKKIISVFLKEKVNMRAGETDKAKSIKSPILLSLIEKTVHDSHLIGPLDIDIFFQNGTYYISEINPRFGGGYPMAYECGINFPRYILNNLNGIINEPEIDRYKEGIWMMKHDGLMIKNPGELADEQALQSRIITEGIG